jgi:hypothetical protein
MRIIEHVCEFPETLYRDIEYLLRFSCYRSVRHSLSSVDLYHLTPYRILNSFSVIFFISFSMTCSATSACNIETL